MLHQIDQCYFLNIKRQNSEHQLTIHPGGFLMAEGVNAPFLLYFYNPNVNDEGRDKKGAAAGLGSP
jgi:hypothetical protein